MDQDFTTPQNVTPKKKSQIPVPSPDRIITVRTTSRIPIPSPTTPVKKSTESTPTKCRTPTRSVTQSQEPSVTTPLKLHNKICVVCGKSGLDAQLRCLHSVAGIRKGLQRLLLLYGGVRISHGYICPVDEEKLLNMAKKEEAFKSQVKENLSSLTMPGIKRGARSSPVSSPKPRKQLIPHQPVAVPSTRTSTSLDKTPLVNTKVSSKSSKKKLFPASVSIPLLPKPPATESMASPLDEPQNRRYIASDHPYGKNVTDKKKLVKAKSFPALTPFPADHSYSHKTIPNPPATESMASPFDTPQNRPSMPFTPSPAEHTYSHKTVIHQNTTSEIACNLASAQQSSTQRYSYITPGEAITIANEVHRGNSIEIAKSIMSNTLLSASYIEALQDHYDSVARTLTNVKHGYTSVLIKRHDSTTFQQLESFNWNAIVAEMRSKFPHFLQLALGIMIPADQRHSAEAIQAVLPRLGMIYAISIQQRHGNLSLVQRMLSTVLTEGLSDVRVCYMI